MFLEAWAESLKADSVYRCCCVKVLGTVRCRGRFIKVPEGQRLRFSLIMSREVAFCQVSAQGKENQITLHCSTITLLRDTMTLCHFHHGSCVRRSRIHFTRKSYC